MAHTVIGFFRNVNEAYDAVDILKSRGFDDNNIDVSSGYDHYQNADENRDWTDKVSNFFRSLFSDNDKANRYSQAARNNPMVTVHAYTEEEAENAADILDDCGAIDVDEKEPAYAERSTGWTADADTDTGYERRDTTVSSDSDYSRSNDLVTGTDYTSGNTTLATDDNSDYDYSRKDDLVTGRTVADTDFQQNETSFSRENLSEYSRTEAGLSGERNFAGEKDTTIPIIEEQVNVEKREVGRGGVRVRSRIIERPVEETLRLREERVRVERTPVNREATEADLANFQEKTFEVREYGEEPVVSKTARVVEEVRVEKEVDERDETIYDTERKTEVDVEEFEKSAYHKH